MPCTALGRAEKHVIFVPIGILAGFNLWSVGPMLDGFTTPASNAGMPGWSFWAGREPLGL